MSKTPLTKFMGQVRIMSQFVPGLSSTQVDPNINVNIFPMFNETLRTNKRRLESIKRRENKENESIEHLRIVFNDLVEIFKESPLSKNENGLNTFGKLNNNTYELLKKLVSKIELQAQEEIDNVKPIQVDPNNKLLVNLQKEQIKDRKDKIRVDFTKFKNYVKKNIEPNQDVKLKKQSLVTDFVEKEGRMLEEGLQEASYMASIGIQPCKTTYTLNDTIDVISNNLPEFSSYFTGIGQNISGLLGRLSCAIYSRPVQEEEEEEAAVAEEEEEEEEAVAVAPLELLYGEKVDAREETKKRIKQRTIGNRRGGKKTKKRQRTRRVKSKSKGKKYKSKKRK
jgi:hypothetical protein